MKLEHDTLMVAADGEKFLLLRNISDQEFIHLGVIDNDASTSAPARELASDRAGRQHDAKRKVSVGAEPWGQSAMQGTDWHHVAEKRSAEDVTERLLDLSPAGSFRHLVVIPDPRSPGAMRNACDDRLASGMVAEIDKDLKNLLLNKIEASI